MGALEGEDVGDLRRQFVHTGGGRAGQERLRDRAKREDLPIRHRPCAGSPPRPVRPGRSVVLVENAGLTWRDQCMVSGRRAHATDQ